MALYTDKELTLVRWPDDDLLKSYIGYIEGNRVTTEVRALNLPHKALTANIERIAAKTSWRFAEDTYHRDRSCFEHTILSVLKNEILKDKPIIFSRGWDTRSLYPICYVVKEACKEYSAITNGVVVNSISSNILTGKYTIREEWRINSAVPNVETKCLSSSFINKLVHSVAKEIWLTLPVGTTIAVSVEYQPPIYLIVDHYSL